MANGNFPWEIRIPGELWKDENRPDVMTMAFLFFDYYVGWRFTYGTNYDLASSVGGAINDYVLLVMLPFFLMGLWAFFFSERKNSTYSQQNQG